MTPAETRAAIDATIGADNRRALAAKLRELGLKIVPIEATEEMMDIGHRAANKARPAGISGQTMDAVIRSQCSREAASYCAMVAAAPDVLGGPDAD